MNITIFSLRVAVRATSGAVQQVRPTEIYNLAAQSHVGESFESPEYTANADAIDRKFKSWSLGVELRGKSETGSYFPCFALSGSPSTVATTDVGEVRIRKCPNV